MTLECKLALIILACYFDMHKHIGGFAMDFCKLQEIAKDLSQKVSRFQLAQLKEEAEQGRGELAGLTRFEREEITRLYERDRLKRSG